MTQDNIFKLLLIILLLNNNRNDDCSAKSSAASANDIIILAFLLGFDGFNASALNQSTASTTF